MRHAGPPCTHTQASASPRNCSRGAEIHSSWHEQVGSSSQNTVDNLTSIQIQKSGSAGVQQSWNGISDTGPSCPPRGLHSFSDLLLGSLTLWCLSSSLSLLHHLCSSLLVPGPARLPLPPLDVSCCPYLHHGPNRRSTFSRSCRT